MVRRRQPPPKKLLPPPPKLPQRSSRSRSHPHRGSKGLTYLNTRRSSDDILPVDIYFLAFHGTYGEDGCIQGMLEMADATYTGCGVLPLPWE